jgi:hypothetical protein
VLKEHKDDDENLRRAAADSRFAARETQGSARAVPKKSGKGRLPIVNSMQGIAHSDVELARSIWHLAISDLGFHQVEVLQSGTHSQPADHDFRNHFSGDREVPVAR